MFVCLRVSLCVDTWVGMHTWCICAYACQRAVSGVIPALPYTILLDVESLIDLELHQEG